MKLIIDTDVGCDDARALITAFHWHKKGKATVIGVTTVFGNVENGQAGANVSRLMRLCGVSNIGIYAGAHHPIIGDADEERFGEVHGKDGLGDVPDQYPALEENDFKKSHPTKHAAQFIIDAAHEHPGEIVLIGIGPLTNIALALQLDPELSSRLRSVHIMGGTMYGVGNIAGKAAEHNFFTDPEAAHVVLHRVTECPLIVFTWEVCSDHRAFDPLEKGEPFDYANSFKIDTVIGRFFAKATEFLRHVYCAQFGEVFTFVDELAVCAALDPTVILDTHRARGVVELQGTHTRGCIAIDWLNQFDKGNIVYVTKYDRKKVDKIICDAFQD